MHGRNESEKASYHRREPATNTGPVGLRGRERSNYYTILAHSIGKVFKT